MNIGFDMSQVKAEEPFALSERLPYGRFKCKAVKVEWRRSAHKGTPNLNLLWECIEGEHQGKVAFEQRWFTKDTAPYFKGWSQEIMKVMLTSHMINEQAYVGRIAMVAITKDTYNGQERQKVQSYYDEEVAEVNETVDASEGASSEAFGDVKPDSGLDTPPPTDEDLPF
jgi:hypothetical protein